MKRIYLPSSLVAYLSAALFAVATNASIPIVSGEMPSLAPLVERVAPAVVNVAVVHRTERAYNPFFDNPDLRRFFDTPKLPGYNERNSVGSGVIIDAERGYVVTNHHVINQAHEIVLTLTDERQYEAELVASDPSTDVALLQIDAEDLTELPLGDSEPLRVGDFVIAIGNPFGLGQTVTSGIVSALGRHQELSLNYEDFIQTDASINPGNSGGALLNLRGEFVGINTAIFGATGANVGVGFAIPSSMAKAVINQLIEYGEVRRGIFGIAGRTLTPQDADALGLKVSTGIYVEHVAEDSEADKSGVKPGDVITSIDDREIEEWPDLRNYIGVLPIGTRFDFTLVRDGKTLQKKGRVGQGGQFEVFNSGPLTGVALEDMTSDHALYQRLDGVVVRSLDSSSLAYNQGMRVDDVIVRINRVRITSIKDLQDIDISSGPLYLTAYRGNREYRMRLD